MRKPPLDRVCSGVNFSGPEKIWNPSMASSALVTASPSVPPALVIASAATRTASYDWVEYGPGSALNLAL
jgi:hypothetical protein